MPGPELRRTRGQTWVIMLTLWLMVFIISSQLVMIFPILPRISEAFRVSDALLGLLGTSYAVCMMVFALATGPVSDRVGRRKVISVGSGAMAVALILHGPAADFMAVLGARALAGVAAGVLTGAAVSYVGDYFPYEDRGRAMGWIMSSVAAGQVFGIPLGTILADQFDFRVPFVLFGSVMVFVCAAAVLGLPQPLDSLDAHPLKLRRAMKVYLDLLRVRATRGCVILYVLVFFSFGVFLTYLPVWLEATVGLTGTQVASVFLVGGLSNVVASPIAGRLSDRFGRKPLIVSSYVLLVPTAVLFPIVVRDAVMAGIVMGIAMVFVAMRLPPMQALMTAVAPPTRRGTLFSLANSVGQLGFGIASALSGVVYTSLGFMGNAVGSGIALLAAALVIWWMVPEPEAAPG